MHLTVALPGEVLLDTQAQKVVAETIAGSYCLLERHRDMTAALAPGILIYVSNGEEKFVALDRGVLVKLGPEVRVAVRDGMVGDTLEALHAGLQKMLAKRDTGEASVRSGLAKLEVGFVRRFLELQG